MHDRRAVSIGVVRSPRSDDRVVPRIFAVVRRAGLFVRGAGPEPFLWLFSLIVLASLDPATVGGIILCPLRIAGIEHCPGCGLGRSVSFLLHGDIVQSLRSHLLGIPATILLLYRIASMIKTVHERTTNDRSAYA